MNKDHFAGFGIGLLAGALIGGVIALLYAPASGKETRQIIKEKASDIAEDVKDKASNIYGEVKNRATGVVHAIKD
jgi:gas vesicle protein